ncbi:hypothetical protein ACSBR2_028474 [Camellia fascicularis]
MASMHGISWLLPCRRKFRRCMKRISNLGMQAVQRSSAFLKARRAREHFLGFLEKYGMAFPLCRQ